MTRPIYAIRPEPGLSATIAAGRALGLELSGEPLFSVGSRRWTPPPLGTFDALLLGSANAVRHGGGALEVCAGTPVYAVGPITAEAALAAGFPVVGVGKGELQGVLDDLAGRRLRLLRLAGAEHVQVKAPASISIETHIVYENRAVPMSRGFARSLRRGGVVLLHSVAAARHFAQECDRHGVARSGLALGTLSSRIAAACGAGWGRVRTAGRPDEAALLVLARDMCQ